MKRTPLVSLECSQVLLRDLVLALPVREGEQRHALRLGEAFQRFHEGRGERFHQRRGGERRPMQFPEEANHASYALQFGHVHVEIQAVDALYFQRHALP